MLVEIEAKELEICPSCGEFLADYSTCKIGIIHCFKCDTKITVMNATVEDLETLKENGIIKEVIC